MKGPMQREGAGNASHVCSAVFWFSVAFSSSSSRKNSAVVGRQVFERFVGTEIWRGWLPGDFGRGFGAEDVPV